MPPGLGDHSARLKALQLSVAVLEQWDAEKAETEEGYLDGLIDKVAHAGKISRKSSVARSIFAMARQLVSQCMASLLEIDDYILRCVQQWGNSTITKDTVEKLSPFNLALIRLGAHRALHHAKPENVGREMQELSRQAFREHANEVTPIFGIFNHVRKPVAKQQAKGGPQRYTAKATQPAPMPDAMSYPPGLPVMNPNMPVVAPTNIPLFMNTMGLNPMMAHSMLMSGASLPHGMNPMMMNPMMMQMMRGGGKGTVRGPMRGGGMQYGTRGEVGMVPATAPENSIKSSSSSGSASGDSGDSGDSSSESSNSDSSERVRRRRKNPTAFPGDNPTGDPLSAPSATPAAATATDGNAGKDAGDAEKGANAEQVKDAEVLEGVESPPLPGMLPGTGRKPSDEEEDENDPTLKMPSTKIRKNILINSQTMAETAEKALKGALDCVEKGTQTEKDPIDGTCTVWRFRKPKKKRRRVMN